MSILFSSSGIVNMDSFLIVMSAAIVNLINSIQSNLVQSNAINLIYNTNIHIALGKIKV